MAEIMVASNKVKVFRGKQVEDLKKLDTREFAKFLKSRERRSVMRNFNVIEEFVKRSEKKINKGKVPKTQEELMKIPGVGRKTANIVLAFAYDKLVIPVDTHVHRISNRIGYVKTKNPYETEFALREKLPREYWIEYNDLLVTWGQNICKPIKPLCSKCKIDRYCEYENKNL